MRVFITGGAGFIGSNLAAHHIAQGNEIIIFDNLSRPRTMNNLEWLQEKTKFEFIQGDVRHFDLLSKVIHRTKPDLIVHLASQVAVTTSIKNPREDFEINALGTFNVLEAARHLPIPPVVFYSSTNKVYGGLEDIPIIEGESRYQFQDKPQGIAETQPLDFHSPYGCSKGAGDQYVRDYARIYGLKTVVFRQSCIYGERQFGIEDQGWVAHFLIAAAHNQPITIYGNGKQVRDLLHVRDLIALYQAAWDQIDTVKGEVFNAGGGYANTLSIWTEFGPLLENISGRAIKINRAEWRPGDQFVFISDNTKAQKLLNWTPKISLGNGIKELWDWVTSNPNLFTAA